MGFDGVEFAGDFGPYSDNPAALKAKLTELGLVASSAHVGFDALNESNIDSTLAFFTKHLGLQHCMYLGMSEHGTQKALNHWLKS